MGCKICKKENLDETNEIYSDFRNFFVDEKLTSSMTPINDHQDKLNGGEDYRRISKITNGKSSANFDFNVSNDSANKEESNEYTNLPKNVKSNIEKKLHRQYQSDCNNSKTDIININNLNDNNQLSANENKKTKFIIDYPKTTIQNPPENKIYNQIVQKGQGKEDEATISHNQDKNKMLCLYLSFFSNKVKSSLQEMKLTPKEFEGLVMRNNKFYFGGKDPTIKNDFDIDDELLLPKQLYVKYVSEKNHYKLVEYKQTTGLFLKVADRLYVDKSFVITFCSINVMINQEILGDNIFNKTNSDSDEEGFKNTNQGIKKGKAKVKDANNSNNIRLNISFLNGIIHDKQHSFCSNDFKIVRIGRSRTCEVQYKHESVSRVQCTFLFEQGNWILYDGEIDEVKSFHNSTNGLWKLVTGNTIIEHNMMLKVGNTTITAMLNEELSK